jgi:hypothetical protein
MGQRVVYRYTAVHADETKKMKAAIADTLGGRGWQIVHFISLN